MTNEVQLAGVSPPPARGDLGRILEAVRQSTPARILAGRVGASYPTATQLALRRDHAEARDAVWAEVRFDEDLGAEAIGRHGLFEVCTRAASKEQYLMRPDLGRQLDDEARGAIQARCPRGAQLQVVLGDGLSAFALAAHGPPLLEALARGAGQRGWSFGRPFFVRRCRVGVLNDVGELLGPDVVVLLIGERPGLATADSLSAYMAWRPARGHTDARRNLVSNIHGRGLAVDQAAVRILALAEQMRQMGTSGPAVKENLAAFLEGPAPATLPPMDSELTPEDPRSSLG